MQPDPSPRRVIRKGVGRPLRFWEIIIGIALLVALWWLIAAIINRPLIVPSPWAVLLRWCELALTGEFWLITGLSLLRILIGFICGMTLGCALAIVMHWHRWPRALLAPLITIIRATPVVSFIIIALIFIKTPFLPSFISFLMVLPLAWENTEAGLNAVDTQLLEMAHVFSFGRLKRIRLIYAPTLKPFLLSAAIACMGLAWKSGVTAEVIASPRWAIGRELDDAKIYLQTTDLFAWTLTLILVSLLLEALIQGAVRHFSRNRQTTHPSTAQPS